VLRATGGGNGQSLGDLRDFAGMRQSKTAFGDESTLGAAAVLSTFQHIKGDQFKQTIVAAQDLATVMGTDLESAALKLGKAMEDPAELLSSLARSGVVLSDAVQEDIKAMAEQGRYTEAHAKLLDEINKRVGGAAEVAGASASGQWAQLKNAISDVGEAIGKLMVPALEALLPIVQKIAGSLNPEADKHRIAELDKASGLRTEQRQLQGKMTAADLLGQLDAVRKARRESFDGAVNAANRFDEASAIGFGKVGNSLIAEEQAPEKLAAQNPLLARNKAGQFELNPAAKDPFARAQLAGLGFNNIGDLNGGGMLRNALAGTSIGAMGQVLFGNRDLIGSSAASLLGGVRGGLANASDASNFLKGAPKDPLVVMNDKLDELEKFSSLLSPERRRVVFDDIIEQYQRDAGIGGEDSPKEKKAREEALKAVESRFLTRGTGRIDPQVKEQQAANKKLDKQLEQGKQMIDKLNILIRKTDPLTASSLA